jgi:hypothetical protein
MRALAVTTTNSEAAGLMTNDVAAEHNMLADRAASRPGTFPTGYHNLKKHRIQNEDDAPWKIRTF